MAYRINQADGLAATNSAIADCLPSAKFVLAAIREAVESERERCVLVMHSHTNVAMDKAAEAIRSPEEECQ